MKSVALFALMLACGAVVANDDAVATPEMATVVDAAVVDPAEVSAPAGEAEKPVEGSTEVPVSAE